MLKSSSRSLRNLLLGATAAVVLGGFAVQTALPPAPAFALAQTQTQSAAPISFADTVERVRGAVVSVKVKVSEPAQSSAGEEQMPGVQPGDPLERFFRQFGQNGQGLPNLPGMPGQRSRPRIGQAQGSGFFISADGYVVTNNHVVENATEVSITLDDGRSVSASVVGTDKRSDLALLKVKDGGNYPFVSFASTSPRVGDWVVAIGNPFGLGGTVTAGIVSARGRDIGSGSYDDYLQIDAPVNRGNSGGPTFNYNGEVVGVNTAIYSPSGGSVGIGFAIPAETVKSVITSLKDSGTVSRGWIGVQIQPVTPEIADAIGLKSQKGALVAEAQANSPAMAAGIRSGDVITAVNGEQVDAPRDLARRIAAIGPEKKADITYVRNGKEVTASVRLGALPKDKSASNEPSGKSERSALAALGLSLAPVGGGKPGVVVAEIDPDGAAAQKGLEQGDVIVEAAGKAVANPSDVSNAIDAARKDGRKSVLLRVKSKQGTHFVAFPTDSAAG